MKNSVDNKLKIDTSLENSVQILGDLDKFINIVDTVNNSNWESNSNTLQRTIYSASETLRLNLKFGEK